MDPRFASTRPHWKPIASLRCASGECWLADTDTETEYETN